MKPLMICEASGKGSFFFFFFFFCILCLAHAFALALADLHFRQNTFKIALFADLHYGEAASEEWGPAQDRNSTRVMSDILDLERPDLVIFLGDILTANNMASPNATKYWNEAVSATMERGIPWTSVFGNHDDMPFEWPIEWFGSDGIPGEDNINEYFRGTTRAELIANEMTYELSQSRLGPKSLWPSISNYVLPINLPSKLNSSTAPAVLLYFLDSGGGSYPEVISAPQAAWFHDTSSVLNPDQSITELAFWHIPTYAYAKVASTPGSSILPPCAGSINQEQVDPQIKEFGFMNILSARGSVKASFVGHNHGLDWCCPYRGMHLCFARHTGYGGYGTWTRGARILELELSYSLQKENEEEEKPRFQVARSHKYINSSIPGQASGVGKSGISVMISTYIRLEDGSISGWLNLSSSPVVHPTS